MISSLASETPHFYFLTLFPDVIHAYLNSSMMKRAIDKGFFKVTVLNIRDFTNSPHKKVDDTPYGGGAGMVLMCQPVLDAFRSIEGDLRQGRTKVLMTSPAGAVFQHETAKHFAETVLDFVFFCGHYEGFDARLLELIPQMQEISIGDFVLTGGELPALAMLDAMARFIPNVVKEASSVENDSFYNGLLDFPHYTKPAVYEGIAVPDVLLSGHHGAIDAWRSAESLKKTQLVRPDLL
ncbi:MAG: tRNA (guanosine(37)-N1)-methyltransferase TrmD [Vampirovibrionales bacterium]|jgi:tRNA (guanine37-N1)-methyltransferase|nr:tRNA (guanosine(37)-N1)-methyltransferase TrmD [Vampirovibrionales bacterium]